jgi:hypothetical protein
VQLDQVLGLTAGTVNRLVNMLGRSGLETGDDKAGIEPLRCRLDPGAGATFLVSGLSLITGLCETAQAGFVIECAAGADVRISQRGPGFETIARVLVDIRENGSGNRRREVRAPPAANIGLMCV